MRGNAENSSIILGFAAGIVSAKYFESWLRIESNLNFIEEYFRVTPDAYLDIISLNLKNVVENIQCRGLVKALFKDDSAILKKENDVAKKAIALIEKDFISISRSEKYLSLGLAGGIDSSHSEPSEDAFLKSDAESWMEITASNIMQYPDALTFMNEESAIFTLPAYLKFFYEAPSDSGNVLFNCLHVINDRIFKQCYSYDSLTEKLTESQIFRFCDFIFFISSFNLINIDDAKRAIENCLGKIGVDPFLYFIEQ